MATVVFGLFGNAQDTTKIKTNLEIHIRNSFENYIKLNELLLKSKNIKFENSFIIQIENSNSIDEIKKIYLSKGILEVDNIFYILDLEQKNIQNFLNLNKEFVELDSKTKNLFFNEIFESVYNENSSVLNKVGPNNDMIGSGSCYSAYQTAYYRCNRNFAVSGTGAVLTAGFNPIAGLIVGGVACANLYNCRGDAYQDYKNCINH